MRAAALSQMAPCPSSRPQIVPRSSCRSARAGERPAAATATSRSWCWCGWLCLGGRTRGRGMSQRTFSEAAGLSQSRVARLIGSKVSQLADVRLALAMVGLRLAWRTRGRAAAGRSTWHWTSTRWAEWWGRVDASPLICPRTPKRGNRARRQFRHAARRIPRPGVRGRSTAGAHRNGWRPRVAASVMSADRRWVYHAENGRGAPPRQATHFANTHAPPLTRSTLRRAGAPREASAAHAPFDGGDQRRAQLCGGDDGVTEPTAAPVRCRGRPRTRRPPRPASPTARGRSVGQLDAAAGARSVPSAAAAPLQLRDPRVGARALVDLAGEHDGGGGRAADAPRRRSPRPRAPPCCRSATPENTTKAPPW